MINLSVIEEKLYSEEMIEVGKTNPIKLLKVDIATIGKTVGQQIGQGDSGTIYEVKDSMPPRVYKVIPQDGFQNGDEIRIAEIAGECGVGPKVHRSFLSDQGSEKFVVIEMDYANLSLGKLMTKLAEEKESSEDKDENELVEKVEELTLQEKKMQEMLQKYYEENSDFIVTKVTVEKKVSMEEAINTLYKKPEEFYYGVFKNIKILATHKIAYFDTHVGNIMPNRDEKGSLLNEKRCEIY